MPAPIVTPASTAAVSSTSAVGSTVAVRSMPGSAVSLRRSISPAPVSSSSVPAAVSILPPSLSSSFGSIRLPGAVVVRAPANALSPPTVPAPRTASRSITAPDRIEHPSPTVTFSRIWQPGPTRIREPSLAVSSTMAVGWILQPAGVSSALLPRSVIVGPLLRAARVRTLSGCVRPDCPDGVVRCPRAVPQGT